MKRHKSTTPPAGNLRSHAERRLKEKGLSEAADLARTDAREIVYELQVHQIELEMQNDELRRVQAEAQEALQKYAELFDFAPVGYFLVDQHGLIRAANLAGAALVGWERSRVTRQPFSKFVAPDCHAHFAVFCSRLWETDTRQSCELTLLKQGQGLCAVVLEAAVLSGLPGSGRRLLLAVNNITTRKHTEETLKAVLHELERRVEERTAELQRGNVRLAQEIEERKRAQQDVAKELRFETLIADLSSKFVNLQPSEVDREIVDAQRRIFESLGLDISGFWQWSAEASGFFRITHFSRGGDGPQPPEGMNSQESLPWFQQQVLAGRTIAVCSMKDLPPEAARDRETFRQFGFKSTLTLPLSVGGKTPIGALGFTTRVEHEWPDMLVKRLQLVAQIFASALARKRADHALRQSEERLATIYNTVEDIIFHLEVEAEGQYRFLSINQSFCRTTGLSQEQVAGKTVTEVIKEPSLTMVLGKYRQAIETKTIVRWVEVTDYPTGRLTGEVSVTPILNDKGKCTHLIGSVHDITERKRTDAALRESEERLRQAAEAAGFGAYRYDLVSGEAFYSPEFLALYGLPPDATIERDPDMVPKAVHPDDKALFLAASMRSSDPHGSGIFDAEFRVLGKDGRLRWLCACGRTVFDGDGQARRPVRAIGIIQDVTERKEAYAALKESLERFRQVADIAQEFIWEVDAEGLYTYASPSVERITGYTPEELVGKKHFYDLFDPSAREELKAAAFRVFAARQTFRDFPNSNVSKSGELVHLESSGVPMLDPAGKLAGYRGADTDVTRRKEAEAELLRQRTELAHVSRVSTLGELSASLAHELNQPLTAILSNAEAALGFLADGNANLGEVRDILNDIVIDDERAGEVIRRLRLLLKKGEVYHLPLDLNEVAKDLLKLLRHDLLNHEITLQTELAPDLPAIEGDRVQLQQVLLNLILNAVDAMANIAPADRHLTVCTEPTREGGVRVSVRDRGAGLAPEVLERIFEPFFTTKSTGMGLGLKVCRTIITSHGGQIGCDNNPEQGAAFYFELPAAERDPA